MTTEYAENQKLNKSKDIKAMSSARDGGGREQAPCLYVLVWLLHNALSVS